MKRLIESNTYLPIINGFIGDKLAASSDSWAIGFSLRLQSKDLTLAEAIKRLKNKNLVIYVHGLMADEKVWKQIKKELDSFFVSYRCKDNCC